MRIFPHTIRLRGPWQWTTLENLPRRGTIHVPGWWRDAGLADYWGRIELRRSFHWTAGIDPEELVFLVLDRCVGRAAVTLNGRALGVHDCPWDSFRFDVTSILQPKNELVVELDAPRPGTENPRRFGSLGCLVGDWTGSERKPVGGIAGLVFLSVESRTATVASATSQTAWEPAGGRLQFSAAIETAQTDPPGDVLAELLLDGHALAERAVTFEGCRSQLCLDLGPLSVEPWQPRPFGEPRLYELSLDVYRHGRLLFDRSWQIGFRSIRLLEDEALCNGQAVAVQRRVCWPDATFIFADLRQSTRWHGTQPGPREGILSGSSSSAIDVPLPWQERAPENALCLLLVTGHAAPDAFYDMCDHEGLVVEQDLLHGCRPGEAIAPPDSGLVARLQAHACVAGWRLQ